MTRILTTVACSAAILGASAPAYASNVLVIWDINNANVDALVTDLRNAGHTVTKSTTNSPTYTGAGATDNPTNYDVVVHLLGDTPSYNSDMPSAGQTAIQGFVNGGGGYIAFQWTSYSRSLNYYGGMDSLILQPFLFDAQVDSYSENSAYSYSPLHYETGSSFTIANGASTVGTSGTRFSDVKTLYTNADGNAGIVSREVSLGRAVNFSLATNWVTFDQFQVNPGLLSAIRGAVFWADTPQKAYIYEGNGGRDANYSSLSAALIAGGASSVVESGGSASFPATLAGYRTVFLSAPTTAFNATQIAEMQRFVTNGGTLVMLGGNSSFASANTNLNNLAASLGVSSRFGSATGSTCGVTSTKTTTTSRFTRGTNALVVGSFGTIAPGGEGVSLFTSGTSNVVVAEQNVVLISDLSMMDYSCGNSTNNAFFGRLFAGQCDPDNDGIQGVGARMGICSDGGDPNGTETCDASNNDEDNDGQADDIDAGGATGKTSGFPDVDRDGYGAGTLSTVCDNAATTTDCNDSNAAINPGATEITGDQVDQNCNSQEICFNDGDDDGYRPSTASTSTRTSTADTDCNDANEALSSDPTTDCDDADSGDRPGATEITGNGDDEDCNGQEVCFNDGDDDGYRPSTASASTRSSSDADCTDASEALSSDPTTDCNDGSASINPGATEITGNSTDENCNGTEVCYTDADNDGYRPNATSTVTSSDTDCTDSSEAVSSDPTTDCDDAESTDFPGATETVANGDDENCDGGEICYADADNDGYRPNSTGTASSADFDCTDNNEAVSTDPTTDCDDADAGDHPGAAEITNNGDDEDCNGGDVCYADADNDGYRPNSTATALSADLDCTDNNEAVSTDPTTDCDDTEATDHPGATETVDNGDDEDCNGAEVCYTDADDDGYRPNSTATTASADLDCQDGGEGRSSDPTTDCDDGDAADHPGATETVANADDEDCDGVDDCYVDADNDGARTGASAHGNDLDCTDANEGVSGDPLDCNDSSAAQSPLAPEICDASDLDEDCDGLADDGDSSATGETAWYQDLDADDYGSSTSLTLCDPTGNYTAAAGTDCDDSDALINPDAQEICDAADTDEDCDGDGDDDDGSAIGQTSWYADPDGDGYGDPDDSVQSCDASSPYFLADGTDCNEASATINPGATEICDASDTDEDCDALADDDEATAPANTTDFYADDDSDGYGDPNDAAASCDPTVTHPLASVGDCDDGDASVNSGAQEVCDALDLDEDCDGLADEADSSATGTSAWFDDLDGDGHGAGSAYQLCAPGLGQVASSDDCDDTDPLRNPSATEICDAADRDEDCDLLADDAESTAPANTTPWYADADADAFGDANDSQSACDASAAYPIADDGDCDDGDAAINPAAAEICDAFDTDEDCDGLVDDADDSVTDQLPFYADGDGDGFGAGTAIVSCDANGNSASGLDCDDGDAAISPAAQEVCDALDVDEDCDGFADDADDSTDTSGGALWWPDADADGYGDANDSGTMFCDDPGADYVQDDTDCADGDVYTYPGATEFGDGVDNDCDGVVDDGTDSHDDDGDGVSEAGGDCDDQDRNVAPGIPEICDGIDQDCDGDVDEGTSCGDDDFDGYSEDQGDCNDNNPNIGPHADEIPSNGIDDDCNGTVDDGVGDVDGDGYTSAGGDCDDTDDTIYPDAPELEDGEDNDCDGTVDDGTAAFDDDGDGFSENDGDCDDEDADRNPDATETVDGVDEDCDGVVDNGTAAFDDDGDGYAEDGGDCDDGDENRNPGETEVGNGVDDNCDGTVDEGFEDVDGDGYGTAEGDCDDTDGSVFSGAAELCDEVDNDCDGDVDEGDCADDTDTGGGGKGCCDSSGTGWRGLFPVLLAGLFVRRRRG